MMHDATGSAERRTARERDAKKNDDDRRTSDPFVVSSN